MFNAERDGFPDAARSPLSVRRDRLLIPPDYSTVKIELRRGYQADSMFNAEREGFEPSIRLSTNTPLAGERFQPLSHLSVTDLPILYRFKI